MNKLLGMFSDKDEEKDSAEDNKNMSEENKKSSAQKNKKESFESSNNSSENNSCQGSSNTSFENSNSSGSNTISSENSNSSESNKASFENTNSSKNNNSSDKQTIRLHKEDLNINKNKVHTGDVELSTEIVEVKQSLDVPVKREEVVIERKSLNNESTNSSIGNAETIRIPVSEEKVQVEKRTVVTEEISAYKRQVENTQHIEETLKSEEAHITKVGSPTIITEEKSNNSN